MGRKLRYIEVRVKGQPLIYQVSRIQYRDKKGRLSKFSPNKFLKVEVIAKREVVDKKTSRTVLRERIIQKHSLGYAKRKKPVTVAATNIRIQKKAQKHKTSLMTIFENGSIKFMSGLFTPLKAKKKKGVRKVKIKLRGSKRERSRTRKNSVQKH